MDGINIENDSLALVLTWNSSGTRYHSRKVLVHGEVEQELRNIVKQMLGSIPVDLPKRYDPDAEQETDQCIQIDQDELFDAKLLESIQPGPSLESIDPDEARARQRYFCYSVVLGTGNEPKAIFIKKTNPVKRATRRWYANFSNGALHRVDRPEFEIEDNFDVLIVPNKTIIAWDQKAFENLFKTSEAVNERVYEWISSTVSSFGDVVVDYEVQKTLAVSNSFRRRKWQSVHSFSKTYRIHRDVLELAMEEAEVEPETLFEDGKLKITEENVDEFLSLMNEDFFKGAISGRKLRAQRKTTR